MPNPLAGLEALLAERAEYEQRSKEAYDQMDGDLCMLCHAYGQDKRNLRVECMYAVEEVVPEALSLRDEGAHYYYLRICKSCRGALLDHMATWREERVALRGRPKDHDGHLEDQDYTGLVCVRHNGRVIYVTEDEWRTRFRQQ